MRIISPSILAADFGNLGRDVAMLNESRAEWIHFDVMDGVFVPNISFGFPVLQSVRSATEKVLDVHLMIVDPIRYVKRFAEAGADIITFHVPLTRDGAHPTYHMADGAFFDRLKKRPLIINTSRGAVVDNGALLDALIYNKVEDAAIDTWENEPCIDRRLLDRVWLATPHIAGYSADGKVNADNMVLDGLCRHFGLRRPPLIVPPALPPTFVPSADDDTLRLQLYNPLEDSARLKASPESFEELRGNYPLRREQADIMPAL